MMDIPTPDERRKAEILRETAKIPWRELERFFANGSTLSVAEGCDLVEVACHMAADNKALIEELMTQGEISSVSDQQAIGWLDNETLVWAVVIKPWVLVQPVDSLQ